MKIRKTERTPFWKTPLLSRVDIRGVIAVQLLPGKFAVSGFEFGVGFVVVECGEVAPALSGRYSLN